MKHIRKILAAMIAVLLTATVFTADRADAQAYIIYQTSTRQNITHGATLENIVRFTTQGWLNIEVLKVDIDDPNIKVDTMSNSQTIGKLTSTISLARENGAVAAVNASFFNPTGNGNGYPDGPIVKSGDVLSTSAWYNRYADLMGSFSINSSKELLFDYWKNDITLIAPNGTYIFVAQYNKPSGQQYNDVTILDRKWSYSTIGVSERYPDITEMLVEDGIVTEIRQAQPAAVIPENGFAVIARGTEAQKLIDNFVVGDTAEFSISSTPDWKQLEMSVTGASILVKDGEIPGTFTFNTNYINQRHPRTLVGSSRDGKQLILVTVDGRMNSSIGLTQLEAAQLMLQVGAYNALNLDGGGSTTMVARKTGTSEVQVVNKPSDGSPRAVSTAIGVFSEAPQGSLAGLIIEAEDTNVFVNTTRSFTVKGYDQYYNPVDVNQQNVRWSVSGIKGEFTGNTLRPVTVGEGKVVASVGQVEAELDISSLNSPVKLTLSPNSLSLPAGQTRTFAVTGLNKDGYTAKINPADVKWAVNGNLGSFENGVFTSAGGGNGFISASVGSAQAYCALSVASETAVVKDTFEKSNGSFLSFPTTVGGSYTISDEQAHGGKTSGKLTYDFSDTEGTRAAYLSFDGNGIPIDAGATKIGVWLYNTHENSGWVRGEVMDTAGNKHIVEFTRTLDWVGWKQIEASLGGITSPAYLSRLYLAQVNPVADSGSIYFDDLYVSVSSSPSTVKPVIPQDTVPIDEANKLVAFEEGEDNFRFSMFGSNEEPRNPLEQLLAQRLSEKVNQYIDMALYTGKNAAGISGGVTKPLVATGSGFRAYDYKNSRFLQLDMSKNGLRSTDATQWTWLFKQLEEAEESNVFVVLSGAPDTFSDSLEAKLLKDTLADYRKDTGKNVWVFYKGSQNTSVMDREVRYISCAGFDAAALTPDNTAAAQYILVTVMGDRVTFEIKPIV